MRRRLASIAGVVAMVALQSMTGCAHTPLALHMNPPPPHVDLGVAKTAVPMEAFHGLPVVNVGINGKGPYKFILDTGAEHCVLSEDLARELGLPDRGHILVGRPGGAAPVSATATAIDELDLGAVKLSGVFAVAMNMSVLWKGKSTPRGILSAASFPGLLVTLNYPAKRVELRRGELPRADGRSVFGWDASQRLPMVPLDLGGVKLQAHLDSGSNFGIGLPTRYATSLRLAGKPVPGKKVKFADGEAAVSLASLDGVAAIGRFTFKNPQIRFVDGTIYANVGRKILEQFSVTFDSANRRIQLDKKAST
jgi:Aspartyl protease